MVTKQVESTPSGEPQAEVSDNLIVEDTTTPEVLAQEAAFWRGDNVDDEPAVESPEPAVPEAAEEPAPAGIPEPVVEAPPPDVTPTRTFSQEEWSKRESAYRRQVEDVRRELEGIKQRDVQQSIDAEVETTLRSHEQQLTQSLGPEEAARVVRDPSRVEQVRRGIEANKQLGQMQQQAQNAERIAATQLLHGYIDNVRGTHGLTKAQAERLQSVINPGSFASREAFMATGNAIDVLGAELAQGAKAQQELEKLRLSRVPAGSRTTRLETGESEVAPDSDLARSNRIMAVTNWDTLSREDREFMRNRVGA